MKIASIFFLLLNLLLLGMMYRVLPERIGTHFAWDGAVNGWTSTSEFVVIMGGLLLFIAAIFWGTCCLVKICPVKLLNVPYNNDYWKAEENLPKMRAFTEKFLWEFALFTQLFLGVLDAAVMFANFRNPPNLGKETAFFSASFFGIYMIWWLVRFLLAYRIPKEPENMEEFQGKSD